jgi:ribosomal protein S21
MKKRSTIIKGRGVDVYHGNFEKALRTFRKKIQKSGLIQDVRDKRYFQKPSDTKRLALKAAKRKQQLANRDKSKRLY